MSLAKEGEVASVLLQLNDSAVEIGQELERMIKKYGPQVIETLLPRIAFLLDKVDFLIQEHNCLQTQNQELIFKLNHLERKRNDREKLETDFELIEEKLKEEIVELREENRRLKKSIVQSSATQQLISPSSVSSSSASLHLPHIETDSHPLSSLNHLNALLSDELQKSKTQTQELKSLLEQSESEARKLLSLNSDLQDCVFTSKIEIEKLSKMVQSLSCALSTSLKDNQEMCLGAVNLRRKSSPPEIPLSNVRKIFLERNQFKDRLNQVQSELNDMKKKKTKNPRVLILPPECKVNESLHSEFENSEQDVQGPINREPAHKLYPSRKFRFFGLLKP